MSTTREAIAAARPSQVRARTERQRMAATSAMEPAAAAAPMTKVDKRDSEQVAQSLLPLPG